MLAGRTEVGQNVHGKLSATEISACRLCRGKQLLPVLDFGVQALSTRFPNVGEPDAPLAPLTLVRCSDCALVQLKHDFDLDELYRANYGYRSGVNDSMRGHLRGIVEEIEKLVTLDPGDVVLDIASNDGTLLKAYSAVDAVRVGIDPTVAIYREHYPEGYIAAAEFFDRACYDELTSSRPAKVVTSIAVLYDVPKLHQFVGDIAAILHARGCWVFEQSYLPSLIRDCSFDSICHEHLCYFCLPQLRRLTEAHGLRIFDAQLNDMNGGSVRCFVCHANAAVVTNTAAINALEKLEADVGINNPAVYQRFMQRIAQIGEKLRHVLGEAKERGATIHIYGASTKGNVLLQLFGIGPEYVSAAAERNPRKWGSRTPGTNIPIISEAESRALLPHYYLVLPWHFREEFIARERDYIQAGGRLIFPLPEVEIFPP